ncbi:hypothetical protein, partial [Bacteroides stercoris]|uniref:hypothetical protein n=1 Tax=Bacteroides stercoris TaxID=46506 RepID=UPI0034A5BD41
QLEENKPIYIGDKQERRCIVHYDTPSITNKTNNFASSQTQNSQSINVQKNIYQIQKYYILLFYA